MYFDTEEQVHLFVHAVPRYPLVHPWNCVLNNVLSLPMYKLASTHDTACSVTKGPEVRS